MTLVATAVLLPLFVPGALARTGCASSYSGDDRPNTLTGDRCDNEINGLGGDDVIRGNGVDELRGGPGRDRIYSGAFDGKRDFVVCGAGRDFASISERDRVGGDCERVVLAIE
jgi:Ca2+-binding RTX toxin-like protein